MVKLASVRETRKYGSRGTHDAWENANVFGYLLAALLLVTGTALLLPIFSTVGVFSTEGGLWLILVGLVFIFIVNVHDLYAQLAGLEFRLPLVTLDPQLALIEVAAPLLQSIGAIVYFMGAFLLLRVARDDYDLETKGQVSTHAYRLLIAAPALWLVGSILNLFQLYESTQLSVQAYQKAVTIPFVVGSLLLLVSSIVNEIVWPLAALTTAQTLATSLALAGTALLLVGGLANVLRVFEIQQVRRQGGRLEKLRGGADETLTRQREEAEAYAPVGIKEDDYTEIEGGQAENPYKRGIVPAANLDR